MNILPQMYVTEIYAWTRRSPLDVDNLDHVTLQLGLQLPWQRSVLSECLFIYNCIFLTLSGRESSSWGSVCMPGACPRR